MRQFTFPLSAILLLFALNCTAQTNINVVFHVVHFTTAQNIPDSCLQQQLDVLNEDFNAQNADLWKVPAAWTPIIGNMNVHFQLATVDPLGNPTTGIERRQTTTTSFTTNDNVKHYSTGGLDAWPDTSYLNIWICNMSGGVPGYPSIPGVGSPADDGVVLHYQFTGRGSYAMAPFNLGRAGTHFVAHWLGLNHFGPVQNCSDPGDGIADTPEFVANIYGGYAPFTVITDACNPTAPGVMWMNFMTYVDDSSMVFFTQGQVDTMTWYLNNMRLGSTTAIRENAQQNFSISVFPSPSVGHFTLQRNAADLSATVTIYDLSGAVVREGFALAKGERTLSLDLSGLAPGMYSLVVQEGDIRQSKLIVIAR